MQPAEHPDPTSCVQDSSIFSAARASAGSKKSSCVPSCHTIEVETPSTSYFHMIVQLGLRTLGGRYYARQEVVTDVGIENDTADAIGLFRKQGNFRGLFSHC